MELIVGIVNDGVAGVPGAFTQKHLMVVSRCNLDPGQPYASHMRQCSLILLKGMDGEQVQLRAESEVKGVRWPVRWACHERTNPDGSLTIRLKKSSDRDWKRECRLLAQLMVLQ